MKRRVMALFLALTMLIGMAPAVFAADTGFTDVAADAWYAEAVKWAVDNNITGGIGNGKFGPDQTCTRGQVVTFLWAAAGKPVMENADNPFTDVKKTDWYYNAVMWAVENGITNGKTPTTFAPNEGCTRAQVVTFLYAAAGKPHVEITVGTFSDVGANDWFREEVQWAVQNGITGGIGNGKFGPNNTCTRSQIALFLYKADGIGGETPVTPTPVTPTPVTPGPAPVEDLKIEIKTEGYDEETSAIIVQEETLTLKGRISGGIPQRIEVRYTDYTGEQNSAVVKGLENWSAEIPLTIGTNTVEVTAFGKNEGSKTLMVHIKRINEEITYSENVKLADSSDYAALEEGFVGFRTDDMGTESVDDDIIVLLVRENSLLLSQIKEGLLKSGDVYVIPQNEIFVTGFSGVYESHRAPTGSENFPLSDYPDSGYEEIVFTVADFGDLITEDFSMDFSQGVNTENPIAFVFDGTGELVDFYGVAGALYAADYAVADNEADKKFPNKGFQLEELMKNIAPSLKTTVDSKGRVTLSMNWNDIVIYDKDGLKEDNGGFSDQVKLSGVVKVENITPTGGVEYHPVWETPEQVMMKVDYNTVAELKLHAAQSIDFSELVNYLNGDFENKTKILGLPISGVKTLKSKIVLATVGINLATMQPVTGTTLKGVAEQSKACPILFLMICLDLEGNLSVEGTVTAGVTSQMQKGFNVQKDGFVGAYGSVEENKGEYHEKIPGTDFYLDVYDKEETVKTLKLEGKGSTKYDMGVGMGMGIMTLGFCPGMIDASVFVRVDGKADGKLQILPEWEFDGFAEMYMGFWVELTAAIRFMAKTDFGEIGVDKTYSKAYALWEETYSTGFMEGVVKDDSGVPIEGVLVTMRNQDTEKEITATTDADGKYELRNVPTGKYIILAQKDGYISFAEKDVEFSRELQKDITLSTTALVRGAVVEIVETGGTQERVPVVGAEIHVVVHDFGNQSQVLAVTDENGKYEFKVPPGRYSVEVTEEGYIGETLSFEITEYGQDLVDIVLERTVQLQNQLTAVEKIYSGGSGYRTVLQYNDSNYLLERIYSIPIKGKDVSNLKEYRYYYDSQGRMIKAVTLSASGSETPILELSYDSAGRIATWTKWDGGELEFTCKYDDQGRLILCDGNQYDIAYTYDAEGRLSIRDEIYMEDDQTPTIKTRCSEYVYEGDTVHFVRESANDGWCNFTYNYENYPFVQECDSQYGLMNGTGTWYCDLGLVQSVSEDLTRELAMLISPDYIGFSYDQYSDAPGFEYDENGNISKVLVDLLFGLDSETMLFYYNGKESEYIFRLEGRITDESGNGISGADIVLRNQETEKELSQITDESGQYSFENLDPAVYQITVKKTDYKTHKEDVSVEKSLEKNIILSLKKSSEYAHGSYTLEEAKAKQNFFIACEDGTFANYPTGGFCESVDYGSQFDGFYMNYSISDTLPVINDDMRLVLFREENCSVRLVPVNSELPTFSISAPGGPIGYACFYGTTNMYVYYRDNTYEQVRVQTINGELAKEYPFVIEEFTVRPYSGMSGETRTFKNYGFPKNELLTIGIANGTKIDEYTVYTNVGYYDTRYDHRDYSIDDYHYVYPQPTLEGYGEIDFSEIPEGTYVMKLNVGNSYWATLVTIDHDWE